MTLNLAKKKTATSMPVSSKLLEFTMRFAMLMEVGIVLVLVNQKRILTHSSVNEKRETTIANSGSA